jgi:serine/threonine protein kinase
MHAQLQRYDSFGFEPTIILMSNAFRQARNGQENLKREINCLKRLKHVNIIQLYDVIDEEQYEKVFLVFELANYSSVRKSIRMLTDSHTRTYTLFTHSIS